MPHYFSKMSHPAPFDNFRPVVGTTAGFLALYYAFLYTQSITKVYMYFREKAKDPKVSLTKIRYANPTLLALTVDRTSGNMVEQAIPFLVSLWLHAVFVSPTGAAKLGWLWLLFRSIYPFLFYKQVHWLSAIPGYILIFMLFAPVASLYLTPSI